MLIEQIYIRMIMDFSVQKTIKLFSDHAIAGAASGFITRLLCQPLDVIKIRFQVCISIYIVDIF